MKRVLPHKSKLRDADCLEVFENISDYVSLAEAQESIREAIKRVKLVSNGRKVAYGWSGGKDSLALEVVMEQARIHNGVLALVPNLEFPEHLEWVKRNKPKGIEHYDNHDLDLNYLRENPDLIFPPDCKTSYPVYTMKGTRRGQEGYSKLHNIDIMFLGRRRQDGNHIPPNFMQRGKCGVTYHSPIADWPIEMVLAVIKYGGKNLPPVYYYPGGWTQGTGPWSGRRLGDKETCWELTIQADRRVVEDAANAGVPGAAEALRRHDGS